MMKNCIFEKLLKKSKNLYKKIKAKRLKWLYIKCRIEFDGKPFTPILQNKIKEMLRRSQSIYLYDDSQAKYLADSWKGMLCKPSKLRFIENAVPVVLSANEAYAPYMAVMLQSLIDNSSQLRKYHFMIFERNFTDKIKSYLINQVSKFPHCEIDFINVEMAFDGIPIIPPASSAYVSIDTFSRFFIPYWLDNYSKVIYCDCDMFAKADIADLFDLNIQDYSMAACISPFANQNLKNMRYSNLLATSIFLLLDNWSRYLNAGVLVFDTKKFKEKYSYQDCFKLAIYYTNRYRIRYDDQDVLALLVKDDYFPLPPEWNYSWLMPGTDKCKILHYISSLKPWKNIPEIANNLDVLTYRNYASNIPLFNEIGVK